MTIAVANVSNTSTFLYWQTTTNQLAAAMSTAVITTDANGTTAQTSGNASISGTFSANSLLGNTHVVNTALYVGNSSVNVAINSTSLSVSNSTLVYTLVPPSSAQVSNGQYFWNANGSFTPVNLISPFTNTTVSTTGTTEQTIDTYSATTYHAAEYMINVFDNIANNHYTSKLVTMHDGGIAYITEYAQITSNSGVGTFTASFITGNVFVQFTPVSSNTTVRFTRMII